MKIIIDTNQKMTECKECIFTEICLEFDGCPFGLFYDMAESVEGGPK